jgi:curved DNA-binding protein CbpA
LRGGEFMTSGRGLREQSAKTLYDVLCARPGDDAETLQSAFRNAAKANHPDLNPGDPDAAKRFRQISAAYRILRNTKQREAYDRLLASQRQQREAHERLLATERAQRRAQRRRAVLSRAAAMAAVIVGLVGGYTLFTHLSMASVEVTRMVEVAARNFAFGSLPNLAETVIVPRPVAARMSDSFPVAANQRPAEIRVAERAADASHRSVPRSVRVDFADGPIVPGAITPAAKTDEPLKMANGDPSPNPAGANSGAARGADSLDARVDRGNASNGGDDKNGNVELNPIDQNRVASAEPQLSSSENDSLVQSPASNLAKPDFKATGKRRVVAKRPATDHTLVRQASVEGANLSQVALLNRTTSSCAGSCSNHPPPLFGVGF